MELKKLSLKKIFSHFKKGGSVTKRGLYTPHRDWMIIIIIFLILLVLTVAIHFALYLLAEKGDLFNKTAEQEIFNSSLKKELIDSVVTEFEAKGLNSSAGIERSVLKDPSAF